MFLAAALHFGARVCRHVKAMVRAVRRPDDGVGEITPAVRNQNFRISITRRKRNFNHSQKTTPATQAPKGGERERANTQPVTSGGRSADIRGRRARPRPLAPQRSAVIPVATRDAFYFPFLIDNSGMFFLGAPVFYPLGRDVHHRMREEGRGAALFLESSSGRKGFLRRLPP